MAKSKGLVFEPHVPVSDDSCFVGGYNPLIPIEINVHSILSIFGEKCHKHCQDFYRKAIKTTPGSSDFFQKIFHFIAAASSNVLTEKNVLARDFRFLLAMAAGEFDHKLFDVVWQFFLFCCGHLKLSVGSPFSVEILHAFNKFSRDCHLPTLPLLLHLSVDNAYTQLQECGDTRVLELITQLTLLPVNCLQRLIIQATMADHCMRVLLANQGASLRSIIYAGGFKPPTSLNQSLMLLQRNRAKNLEVRITGDDQGSRIKEKPRYQDVQRIFYSATFTIPVFEPSNASTTYDRSAQNVAAEQAQHRLSAQGLMDNEEPQQAATQHEAPAQSAARRWQFFRRWREQPREVGVARCFPFSRRHHS